MKSYQLLTIPEVARRLGYKTRYPVYRLIKDNLLRTCTIRHRIRVAEADLDDFIASIRKRKGERRKSMPPLLAVEVQG
jgi:excisionase family DNA binding protein